jgi:hypothetical protein
MDRSACRRLSQEARRKSPAHNDNAPGSDLRRGFGILAGCIPALPVTFPKFFKIFLVYGVRPWFCMVSNHHTLAEDPLS